MSPATRARAGEAFDASGPAFEMHIWAHGPMSGPPLHVHHNDDEGWHVLDGGLWFQLANERVEVAAGGTIFVPAGVPHTFGSDADVRYLIVSTPNVFALIEALHAGTGEPDAEIYRRFDSEIVG